MVFHKWNSLNLDIDGDNAIGLFHINKDTPRTLSTPIFVLHNILRNSFQVSQVVRQRTCNTRITKNDISASNVLTNTRTGHNIRSETVIYHKWLVIDDSFTSYVVPSECIQGSYKFSKKKSKTFQDFLSTIISFSRTNAWIPYCFPGP